VQDRLLVAVLEANNNLFEYMAGYFFFKLTSSANVGQKITSTTNLHNKYNVLCSFKRFVQFDNVVMSCPPQNIKFLHYFALRCLLIHELLVDWLQCNKFTWQSVYS